ncbi:MAG: aminomethyl-transferring glycine dehydrogenase [Myxococcota bacterium]|nr:aminomethyl-transferring glycine dehydrogenase [Myxococcota bacterium]
MPVEKPGLLPPTDAFEGRHVGPRPHQIADMLESVGASDLSALVDETLPGGIRTAGLSGLPDALDERQALERLHEYASENRVLRSYLGYGYHDTITPPVILRNVLENPGWYTAYTPYQAEISQGRLEALLVFQTMVEDLTGMELSNASLLDEATAAAEAMTMAHRLGRGKRDTFLVSDRVHPQTIAVLQTRAAPLRIRVQVGPTEGFDVDDDVFGALVQYPATDGGVDDHGPLAEALHARKALLCVSVDLLSLTMLRPPGEFGADIVVGNSQRFGVPLGYGGPHAAFMATRESYRRTLPGRIIGISKDAHGRPALRMALQTREQHIRRQKATSNICTAQVLLAVVAGMYGVWHGPDGLRRIAARVAGLARMLGEGAESAGLRVVRETYFDTLQLRAGTPERRDAIIEAALQSGINLRAHGTQDLIIALDERTTPRDLDDVLAALGAPVRVADMPEGAAMVGLPTIHTRASDFMTHETFQAHRSETAMLRYLARLQKKDLALDTSMIPLGSCTMKLNATTEMMPVTWRAFGGLHPFVPTDQALGYQRLFADLEAWLAEVTGFAAVSLQPNAGSQGEYTGLLSIRAYHRANGESDRDVCLIPGSAHGTNPASAVMAGMRVVAVGCDDHGNIDVADLRAKAEQHGDRLAALMVTYPSTHGVFEEAIREICEIVHRQGGQVYMDGANMNAMVGLSCPGEIGADVLHLNLHKTFCIPHGGGGPGMGPIGVAAHLAPFLPGHPVVKGVGGPQSLGTVSSAPWGSPSILPISWSYIAMMGGEGLRRATEVAILNANYVAERLKDHYPVLYTGKGGRVAHECILDLRHFKTHGIESEDVAKRLMDFGFHAPTMSFPVAGTLMVEPTESEDQAELDRFCDAMIAVRNEIQHVIDGQIAVEKSPLKLAPHTATEVTADTWDRAYSRQQAAWPAPWLREHKYWPTVGRIDNAWGDRNLFCSCNAWGAVENADG